MLYGSVGGSSRYIYIAEEVRWRLRIHVRGGEEGEGFTGSIVFGFEKVVLLMHDTVRGVEEIFRVVCCLGFLSLICLVVL